MRQTFGLDMDDTLSTLTNNWIDLHNEEHKDNVNREDVKTWDICSYVKTGVEFLDYLKRPNFFQTIGVKPNAIETVEWLSKSFDIYVVTAYHPASCYDKAKWLEKYFPMIDQKNIIFCNNKGLVHTDFLLDDGLHNIDAYTKHNPNGKPIIFSAPWNTSVQRAEERLDNWSDLPKLLTRMYGF